MLERTIILIKPNNNERSIATSILQVFKNNGLSIENVEIETENSFSTINAPFYKISVVGIDAISKANEIAKTQIIPNFSSSVIYSSESPTSVEDEINKLFKTNLKNQTFNDLIKNPVKGENYQIKITIPQINLKQSTQIFKTIENELNSIPEIETKNYGLSRKMKPNGEDFSIKLLFEFTIKSPEIKINNIKVQIETQLNNISKDYKITIFEQLIKKSIVDNSISLINYNDVSLFGPKIPNWQKKR